MKPNFSNIWSNVTTFDQKFDQYLVKPAHPCSVPSDKIQFRTWTNLITCRAGSLACVFDHLWSFFWSSLLKKHAGLLFSMNLSKSANIFHQNLQIFSPNLVKSWSHFAWFWSILIIFWSSSSSVLIKSSQTSIDFFPNVTKFDHDSPISYIFRDHRALCFWRC